jgi:hypothetical protein
MSIPRRAVVLSLPALWAAAGKGPEARHVTVYAEKGRFGGWPANHGLWSWGAEIACGFGAAYFLKTDPERHQRDRSRPEVPAIARSLDAGETWRIEFPESLQMPAESGRPPVPLRQPMDFSAPGFALKMRADGARGWTSMFWLSADRARTWSGPFEFPALGTKGIAARTAYLVLGPREALVFLTAAKENGREGRPFCAHTADGGLSWSRRGWVGEEPPGFSIMPSAVRLPDGRILCAVRVRLDEKTDWIDLYASGDEGASWRELARPVQSTGGKSGNPPSLTRLPDGRLVLTWGHRGEPYSIRAAHSDDEGRSWSEAKTLRGAGGAWDLGYTRDSLRPDGKLVTLYYWSPAPFAEREIHATIWDPGKRES